jgi:alginate O-acetyltransferase complex protein AlgI
LWGFLHGFYLLINHWFSSKGLFAGQTSLRGPFWRFASSLLTFACVVIAWVIFRAESLRSAAKILGSMAFLHGPENSQIDWRLWIPLAGFGLFVVWVLPNTHELMRNHQPDLAHDLTEGPMARAHPTWHPNIFWLGLTFVAFALSLALVTSDSPFIYFQF